MILLLCPPLVAKQTASKHGATVPPINTEPSGTPAENVDPAVEPQAKVLEVDEKDIVRIHTKLRHTTLLILPKSEKILDFICGDKEFWIVDGTENFAYVKPAKPGAETNLNLVTASGNIYSFALVEVSGKPEEVPDLKVFIEPKESSMIQSSTGSARFVSSEMLEDYRRQIDSAKEETRQAKDAAQAAIDKGISQFVSNVRFPYRFQAGKKPFGVRAMYNDDKFTYIQARPEETPAIYELKDGKPNVVTFQYKNGVYVVDKILGQGYLRIGDAKLTFKREE
jgi:type IV secretion system protein VirB9